MPRETPLYRYDIINALIQKYGYQSYLEIGLARGETFAAVRCEHKDSVDIAGNPTFKMTSDAFFAQNPKELLYDIIFVDGDHSTEQARRDVENALRCCPIDGTIVIHDCSPGLPEHATDEYTGGCWMGGVWKVIAELRARDDLVVYTVNTDCGVAVVRRGVNDDPFYVPDNPPFTLLENYRQNVLNLVSVDEFEAML
jgi:hypothetical protein